MTFMNTKLFAAFFLIVVIVGSSLVFGDIVQAPCAAPSIGCPQGATCIIASNPADNKCSGGITNCGDSNKDCIDDCTRNKLTDCTLGRNDSDYSIYRDVLILVLLFAILVTLWKRKK